MLNIGHQKYSRSTKTPKSLLIIGGDNIAVEIAQLMATFGTKVYIVEAHGRLLPRYDEEVGNIIEKVLSEQRVCRF